MFLNNIPIYLCAYMQLDSHKKTKQSEENHALFQVYAVVMYLVSFYHQSCMQTVYGTLAVHARLIFFVNIVFRKSKL